MTILNSQMRRSSRIAAFCLVASALLPTVTHAGGHGGRGNSTQPIVTQDIDRLQQQLSVLENRIAKLEGQAVDRVTSPDDKARGLQLPLVVDGN